MSFDYSAKLTAVKNALTTYNTTTSSPYLSDSLTSAIDSNNIFLEEPKFSSLRGNRYPAIFISISHADQGLIDIGNGNSNKEKTVVFDVVGVYKKEGGSATYESLF